MRRVINYVTQEKKTLFESYEQQFKLISGKDCCPDIAFEEFMATKKRYGKDVGMFFYQYVQSFSPDESITPEKAHQVGVELANYFKDYEVLISTHIDAEHIHNHFIINSVSHITGLKLQEGPDSLLNIRKLSDEICLKHGLSVLKPYTNEGNKTKSIDTREYRSALKGDSWKFKLINAIDKAIEVSRSKAEFIDIMASYGYQTNWTENRKHITYVIPDGKKCRDNKLHEEKYLKAEMEGYFNEFTGIKKQESTGNIRSTEKPVKTLRNDYLQHSQGTMGGNNNSAVSNGEVKLRNTGIYYAFTDTGIYSQQAEPHITADGLESESGYGGVQEQYSNFWGNDENDCDDGIISDNEKYSLGNGGQHRKTDRKPQSKGFITNKCSSEMDRNRSINSDSVMDATNILQSFIKSKESKIEKEIEINVRRNEHEFKQQREFGNSRKQSIDNDFNQDDDQEFDLYM